jgi:hypothetical protein
MKQANAEAPRARQDRIAQAEIDNGRYVEVTTSGEPSNTVVNAHNNSDETSPPVNNALQGLYKNSPASDVISSSRSATQSS